MATESNCEILLSLLCTKDNWTVCDDTYYTCLAFREDGVGLMRFVNDQQPGALLICEFDWEIYGGEGEATIDTRQKDLEDSLRTHGRDFVISMKIRKCAPRENWDVVLPNLPHKELLIRRLKEVTFEEEEYLGARLEVGNFPPEFDSNMDGKSLGLTRWGLRLKFDKSPVPSLDKWNKEYENMAESQHWEKQTNWFSRKLRGSGGWNFTG
ncbi:hypothetical protein DM02DRAFT_653084 [Periconia macrospinosa]|uniref:Uncharacterized protein n=1 Tax=Periconia macrospinosa TaxID=97972 RepID=A0A2V1DXM5_9PLEO|nr:hypothetical protein DM02DRAFT_653084 [Periconia macrospinosa]